MTMLLKGEALYNFETVRAQVTTFASVEIDGTFHRSFFEEDEADPEMAGAKLIPWKMLQGILFDLVKGRHKPLEMKLVLRLMDRHMEKFLSDGGYPFRSGDVSGLYLNIRYTDRQLTCTSGTSLAVFSPDRSLDRGWDEAVQALLAGHHIAAEQL